MEAPATPSSPTAVGSLDAAAYEDIRPLGRGGMGVVWRARHRRLGREVALKILRAPGLATPTQRARFERETRAVARLDHPNIVPVYEVGEWEGAPAFTMRLVEGGTLDGAEERFRGNPRAAARLVAKLARAMAHAHGRGVLHRDLKPANVLLDEGGEPSLTDFGLAKLAADEMDVTLTAEILGTPQFMAPEQAEGRPAGEGADIYGLGAILYFLLAGRAPFAAGNSAAVLRAVLLDDPAELPPEVPRDLAGICAKCLEKQPASRYASAVALAEDLEAWLAGRPTLARPSSAGERALRWARRNPALAVAVSLVALLLVCTAVVSTIAALRLDRARERAEVAERDAKDKLRDAWLAQARFMRRSGRAGQRFDTLALLRNAAGLRVGDDLRDEAAAALALPDLRVARRLDLPARAGNRAVIFDRFLRHGVYAHADGGLRVFRVDDLAEIANLRDPDGLGEYSPATWSANGRWLEANRFTSERMIVEIPSGRYVGAPTNPFAVWDQPNRFRSPAMREGEDTDELLDMLTGEAQLVPAIGLSTFISRLGEDPRGELWAFPSERTGDTRVVAMADGAPRGALAALPESLAWSDSGEWIATLETERARNVVWSRATLRPAVSFDARHHVSGSAVFCGGEQWLALVVEPATLELRSLATGRAAVSLAGVQPATLNGPSLGHRLACVSVADEAQILEIVPSPVVQVFRPSGGADTRSAPAWVDGGRALVAAALDGPVPFAAWDGATGKPLVLHADPWEVAEGSGEFSFAVVFDGKVRRISVTRRPDGALSWRESGTTIFRGFTRLEGISGDLAKALVTERPQGAGQVVFAFDDEAFRCTDFGGTAQPGAGALHPSGRFLATSLAQPTILSADDARELRRLPGRPQSAFAFSPGEGRWMVAADPVEISLFEAAGEWPRRWVVPNAPRAASAEQCLAVSADGSLVAAEWDERRVRLLDGATGRALCLLEVPTHGGAPPARVWLAFHPDGQRLAMSGPDGTVAVWDLPALRRELTALGLGW